MAWDTNARHIRAALAAARDAGVGILCLPELCITGYGCEDMFFSAGVQQTALDMLQRAACPTRRASSPASACPCFTKARVYNAAAVACDGKLLGLVAKQHLAGDGIHYEPRWFRRWPAGDVGAIEIGGQRISDRRPAVRLRRRADRPRNLPRRLGRRPHRRSARRSAGPTCCSIPAPAISRSPSSRFASGSCWKARGRFASATPTQPAGQRGGPLDLRRRHAHRQRRQDARPRPAVLVCRLAADDGRHRRRQHAPREGREFSDTNRARVAASDGGPIAVEFDYPDWPEPTGSVDRQQRGVSVGR